MPQAYPWRDGRTVTEVVRAHRDILIRAGILDPGPGYSAAEIKAIERRITNVPADVRELYAAARPRQVGSPSIRLFKPDSDAPLAQCPRLRDACFRRCHLRGVTALADAPALMRLRLND